MISRESNQAVGSLAVEVLGERHGVGYHYEDALAPPSERYLWSPVRSYLRRICPDYSGRVFELGCGNGAFTASLHSEGYDIIGLDPSDDGIRIGRACYPGVRLEQGSAYDDLAPKIGRFKVVISLEVIEHVYAPRTFVKTAFDLLEENGVAIISTPYHGYWKNVALALSGSMDRHFTALWDHGHIKFWSPRTITELLTTVGFTIERIERVGRVPWFAKSMIVIARKATDRVS